VMMVCTDEMSKPGIVKRARAIRPPCVLTYHTWLAITMQKISLTLNTHKQTLNLLSEFMYVICNSGADANLLNVQNRADPFDIRSQHDVI